MTPRPSTAPGVPSRGVSLHRLVVTHQLEDVPLRVAHVHRAPAAPSVVDGGDVEPQRQEAVELRGEIALVDLEREVMERRSFEPDRLTRILGDRDGQGLVNSPMI